MKLTKETLTKMVKETIQEQMEEVGKPASRDIYDVNISFKLVLSKGAKIDKDSLKTFLEKVKEYIYGGSEAVVYAYDNDPENGYDEDVVPSHLKVSVKKALDTTDTKKAPRVIKSYK